MMLDQTFEQVLQQVQDLDRDGCKDRLRRFRLPLDFTDDYLDGLELERLRHVVIAAWFQARKGGK